LSILHIHIHIHPNSSTEHHSQTSKPNWIQWISQGKVDFNLPRPTSSNPQTPEYVQANMYNKSHSHSFIAVFVQPIPINGMAFLLVSQQIFHNAGELGEFYTTMEVRMILHSKLHSFLPHSVKCELKSMMRLSTYHFLSNQNGFRLIFGKLNLLRF
jgi:hypothetical protein